MSCEVCRSVHAFTGDAELKIFIEVGGHFGENVLKFVKDGEDADRIVIWEPSPLLRPAMEHLKSVIPKLEVIEAAAWSSDCELDFFNASDNFLGSTVLQGKKTGNVNYVFPKKVKALDFDRWLRETTSVDDTVILVMNVEGAEYEIVPVMMANKTLDRLSSLFLHLHRKHFVDSRYDEIHWRILDELDRLRDLGVEIRTEGRWESERPRSKSK